jgi:CRISPR-associated protein Csm5
MNEVISIKLRTLSPLHVGDGGRLLPTEFAFLKEKVYVLSEEKLSNLLIKEGLLNEFIFEVREEGKRFCIEKFFEKRNLLNEKFLESVKSYSIRSLKRPSSELRTFVKNGFNHPYIPGSTIKGSLRTAILYYLLKHTPDKLHELASFVSKKVTEFKRDRRRDKGWFREKFKKTFASEFEKKVFQEFMLTDNQKRFDPHSDIMRVIQISDSNPLEPTDLKVEEVKIYSEGRGSKEWSIYVETIPPGKELQFKISINKDLWKEFRRKNSHTRSGIAIELIEKVLLDPFLAAEEMVKDLYNYEKNFIEGRLRVRGALDFNDTPNFRLGWGGGLLGTTVDLLLSEDLRREIRNTFFKQRGMASAPKTRKITVGDGYSVLGWTKVFRI